MPVGAKERGKMSSGRRPSKYREMLRTEEREEEGAGMEEVGVKIICVKWEG